MANPLLDKYDQMQRRPFGSNTALSDENARGVGGTAGSQTRKQASAYARALRILDRQARRGDANAALKSISVRDAANESGFSPGGIQRKSEVDAMTRGRVAADTQSAQDMQRAQQVERQRLDALLGNRPLATQPPAASPEMGATDAPEPPNNRLYAALDILEGDPMTRGGPNASYTRGFTAAKSLGVANPNTILQGDQNLKYRQTLDTALGQAKTPEEVAALKARGTRYGVPAEAFDRRVKWWENNRR